MTVPHDIYRVKIQIRPMHLDGGIPNNPEIIKGWLNSRMTKWAEEIAKGRAELPEEGSIEAATLKQIEETKGQLDLVEEEKGGWCTFKRDERGIYIEPRQVKAMLREAAVGLGLTRRPPLGCKQDLREYCAVRPWDYAKGGFDRLRFYDEDGNVVKDVDGSEERPISVKGPAGVRTSIKRNDFIDGELGRFVHFDVRYVAIRPSRPTEEEFQDMLEVCQDLGLGANRSQGQGMFDVVSIEVLEQHHHPPVGKDIKKGKKADEAGE